MSTRLILIRHGQTDSNLKRRYSGFLDVDINATGRKQARRLAGRLKDEAIHKVYVSDRKRALSTARIAFKGFKIETVPDLREMHFGIFEGLTFSQIMRRYPRIYKQWLHDPFRVIIPEGESLREAKVRVARAIKKIILDNPHKTIAVVSHGGAISLFLMSVFKSRNFWRQIPGSASITEVEYESGKPKIRLVNDTSHLDE